MGHVQRVCLDHSQLYQNLHSRQARMVSPRWPSPYDCALLTTNLSFGLHTQASGLCCRLLRSVELLKRTSQGCVAKSGGKTTGQVGCCVSGRRTTAEAQKVQEEQALRQSTGDCTLVIDFILQKDSWSLLFRVDCISGPLCCRSTTAVLPRHGQGQGSVRRASYRFDRAVQILILKLVKLDPSSSLCRAQALGE